jgi:diaminohydroxyphosphoribosylaminopyrimidine deaminase/5-amino-6-(5-phosphoribosylamino)uracil reductase
MIDLMNKLGSRNITSVMIEGGSRLNSAAWQAKIVNKVIFFAAPKIFGGDKLPVIGPPGVDSMAEATNLKISKVEYLDPDILIEAYVK